MATPVPPSPGWDLPDSPFHAGELAVQERVGVRAKVEAQGRRSARRVLTAQHRAFFPLLPYLFVGSVDASGQPWASMLLGAPGFVSSPEETALRVRARPLFGDPLNETLREGAELATLGVELPTRRRNRAFGVAEEVGPEGFTLRVRQTLGVCPQYIQGRAITFTADPLAPTPRPVHRGARLDAAARSIIAGADTYFVASTDPRVEDGFARGTDISHRGGRAGFVRIDDDGCLTAPDFVGNFMFNTLGNFQVEPRAGLLFVDFVGGDVLYLAARAEVVWDGPEVRAFAGAQRLVRYHIQQVVRVECGLPARFSEPDLSPLLERTGSWQEVARSLAAEELRNAWRPFRVASVRRESASIRSFLLEPADGLGVTDYQPGQFLPLRLAMPGGAEPLLRTYTLSDAPDGRSYRISVKREGRGGVSDWLHDDVGVGTVLEAMAPRGSFTFDAGTRRPAVLISAGVGITPMLAMLNSLMVNEGRTRHHQRLVFLHAARNGREHAFAGHLRDKARLHANLTLHVRYSQPGAGDVLGESHDSEGHVDATLLRGLLALDDYDFYLCGPAGFTQAVYDALLSLGVRDGRIHAEAFGPAALHRQPGAVPVAQGPAEMVRFAGTGTQAEWRPGDGSLLDVAERAGLAPLASCRAGVCGTCATRVVGGGVSYAEPPVHAVAADEALICCATPLPGGVVLDL